MPVNKKGRKMSPVKAGLTGTAIVAAGVAAVALSKKENRRKAGKALKDLSVKGKKLTKKATNGVAKIMQDEEFRDSARNALSAVKKIAKSKTAVGTVKKKIVSATKSKVSGKKTAAKKK